MSVKIDGWAMTCWRGTALTRTAIIGGTTTHALKLSRDMIEKASATSYREYLPGLTEWSVDVERMVLVNDADVSVTDEITDLSNGTVINVCLQIGLDYYVGSAVLERVTVTAPLRGKATAQISARGTGGLTVVDVDNDGFDYALPMAFDVALNESE